MKIKFKTCDQLMYIDPEDISVFHYKKTELTITMKNGDTYYMEFLSGDNMDEVIEVWDKKFGIVRTITA